MHFYKEVISQSFYRHDYHSILVQYFVQKQKLSERSQFFFVSWTKIGLKLVGHHVSNDLGLFLNDFSRQWILYKNISAVQPHGYMKVK